MGHLDHATFGWLTPTLSSALACTGSALGLCCLRRALAGTGRSRRNWLLMAASAIGTGVWTAHSVALLGVTVRGTGIRYEVPWTVLSLAVASAAVGAGLLAIGQGHRRTGVLLGGLTIGLGTVAAHYVSLAALRIHGTVHHGPMPTALSVGIAVPAATAGLWAAVTAQTPVAVAAAALVMGAAAVGTHHMAMLALDVRVRPAEGVLPGAAPGEFVLPLALGLGAALCFASAFVALSPAPAPAGRSTAPTPVPAADRTS